MLRIGDQVQLRPDCPLYAVSDPAAWIGTTLHVVKYVSALSGDMVLLEHARLGTWFWVRVEHTTACVQVFEAPSVEDILSD